MNGVWIAFDAASSFEIVSPAMFGISKVEAVFGPRTASQFAPF